MSQKTESTERMEVKHWMLFKAKEAEDKTASTFSNSFGDLKKNIEYLIGMERQSGRMDKITPIYVSRMLNVPLEEIERVMKAMWV